MTQEDKPLADPASIDFENMTDEEFAAFEHTTLMAPDDMADEMQNIMQFLRGDVLHEGLVMPRFGLLSLKARRTPMYCYGHPELKEKFAKSFNDGKHIYVSDDYMRVMISAEDREEKALAAEIKINPAAKTKRPKEGMVPLMLHHLMHMIMNHHKRFKGFAPELTAIGADISVYSKLRLAFPDMEWVPELEEAFPASKLNQEDLKKYAKLAEDTIIREVAGRYRAGLSSGDETMEMEEDAERTEEDAKAASDKKNDKKEKKEKKSPGEKAEKAEKGEKSEKSEKSEGDDAEKDPESDNNDAESGGGPEMDKEAMAKALKEMGMKLSKAMVDELDGPSDTIDMKEMSSIAQEQGLTTTQERLELPAPWDYSKIDAIEKDTRLADIDDITKSVKMAGKAGSMGGGHLEGAAHEEVIKETEGKLSWKMGLQEILGESMKFSYSEAEAGDLYYIDPKDMGLDMEVFIGTELPHKTEGVVMVLLDTSGSITQDLFKMFMSEIFGLIKNENPESGTASEVVLLYCDDVLRGDPILITEHNYEELSKGKMQVQGRGGNDIGGTIKAASKLPMFEEKKVTGIIYFTDLGDAPPTKKDVPEGVPLVFICPPDYYQDEFIKAVKSFARVYPIEEGMEVDLTREGYVAGPEPQFKTKRRSFGG